MNEIVLLKALTWFVVVLAFVPVVATPVVVLWYRKRSG